MDVFAGMPVADLVVALDWYERLLGRPPDVRPHAGEAMWRLAGGGWVYVVADADRAGHSLLTLMVDDLPARLDEIARRGIPVGDVETRPGLFRKTVLEDPAGNSLQLGEDLTASGARATAAVPELFVRRGRAAVEFYEAAFGAAEVYRVGGTDAHEAVVAQLTVGDATFWVADESPELGSLSPESAGASTVRVLLIVDDPVAVVERAVAHGATELSPVGEEHRWLLGRIEDPFGHRWEIGRPLVPWPP